LKFIFRPSILPKNIGQLARGSPINHLLPMRKGFLIKIRVLNHGRVLKDSHSPHLANRSHPLSLRHFAMGQQKQQQRRLPNQHIFQLLWYLMFRLNIFPQCFHSVDLPQDEAINPGLTPLNLSSRKKTFVDSAKGSSSALADSFTPPTAEPITPNATVETVGGLAVQVFHFV
jgi:hypothetical protein